MKTVQIILTLVILVSCGKDGNKSSQSLLSPKSEKLGISQNTEAFIQDLPHKGIHFARLSNMQDLKRPLAIYCSNTALQNYEKVTELNNLLETLSSEIYFIDKKQISKDELILLIGNAIKALEADPYTTTCPKIYLSIQEL